MDQTESPHTVSVATATSARTQGSSNTPSTNSPDKTSTAWNGGEAHIDDGETGWSDSEGSDTNEPNTKGLVIRDYAYAATDDRFSGVFPQPAGHGSGDEDGEPLEWAELNASGELGLTGLVRALYDFTAENPSELSFKEDDLLYIQYKQCAGWFVGYLNGQVGLIPENYIQFMKNS
ncbi:HOG (high osmolarity glycerol) pathway protein [Dimargaris cristalligena]|nr:HOG (high osmolarity glycerol) pathway protein [Dimargaris cristalligena]